MSEDTIMDKYCNPNWPSNTIMAFANAIAEAREDALKEVGEWLGKCHTYEDPKYRGRCDLCDGIKALCEGRMP